MIRRSTSRRKLTGVEGSLHPVENYGRWRALVGSLPLLTTLFCFGFEESFPLRKQSMYTQQVKEDWLAVSSQLEVLNCEVPLKTKKPSSRFCTINFQKIASHFYTHKNRTPHHPLRCKRQLKFRKKSGQLSNCNSKEGNMGERGRIHQVLELTCEDFHWYLLFHIKSLTNEIQLILIFGTDKIHMPSQFFCYKHSIGRDSYFSPLIQHLASYLSTYPSLYPTVVPYMWDCLWGWCEASNERKIFQHH